MGAGKGPQALCKSSQCSQLAPRSLVLGTSQSLLVTGFGIFNWCQPWLPCLALEHYKISLLPAGPAPTSHVLPVTVLCLPPFHLDRRPERCL